MIDKIIDKSIQSFLISLLIFTLLGAFGMCGMLCISGVQIILCVLKN
jgi:hypothetical protein